MVLLNKQSIFCGSNNMNNYFGDGQHIHVIENCDVLKISGDGCKVVVDRNNGKIVVAGDGCSLLVKSGNGNICWKGDYGRIELGKEVSGQNVECKGDGCKIYHGKHKPKTPKESNSNCDTDNKSKTPKESNSNCDTDNKLRTPKESNANCDNKVPKKSATKQESTTRCKKGRVYNCNDETLQKLFRNISINSGVNIPKIVIKNNSIKMTI